MPVYLKGHKGEGRMIIAINTMVTMGFENADLKSVFIISAIFPRFLLPTLSLHGYNFHNSKGKS